MRQHRLFRGGHGAALQGKDLSHNTVRRPRSRRRSNSPWRGIGAPIGQIDDLALVGALDRGIRFVDEAFEALGQW